jgi:hypothetical protein
VVTTSIEKKQLSEAITDKMLGAEPTEMKVDGFAWFEVGSESFEIHFEKTDIDPYNPLVEDIGTEPVESGTQRATNA